MDSKRPRSPTPTPRELSEQAVGLAINPLVTSPPHFVSNRSRPSQAAPVGVRTFVKKLYADTWKEEP
eukprot:5707931-Pyramimonas_sp.AAC.1